MREFAHLLASKDGKHINVSKAMSHNNNSRSECMLYAMCVCVCVRVPACALDKKLWSFAVKSINTTTISHTIQSPELCGRAVVCTFL